MRISPAQAAALGLMSQEEAARARQTQRQRRPRGRRDREGEEGELLVARFADHYPEHERKLLHIPNGGARSAAEAGLLKVQGVRKGVHDYFLAMPRGGFHGLWLELKATPPHSAAITPEQREWAALMQAEGYRAVICKGVEAAWQEVAAYLALPALNASS